MLDIEALAELGPLAIDPRDRQRIVLKNHPATTVARTTNGMFDTRDNIAHALALVEGWNALMGVSEAATDEPIPDTGLTFERTASIYAIEVAKADMLAILEAEGWKQAIDTSLYTKLMNLDGVDLVEYNGHFGSFVRLRIGTAHDVDTTHRAIAAVITDHIKACREALKSEAS